MNRNAIIAAGVGLGLAGLVAWYLSKKDNTLPNPNDLKPNIDPNNPPVNLTGMPINIFYMTDANGNPKAQPWGAVAGWITGPKYFTGVSVSWEVDGVPLGDGVVPTQSIDDISSIKAIITDGIISGSMEVTPAQITENYGIATSNVVGAESHVIGTGKLSGKRVYNNMGLTPEYVFVSFKKTKYPDNAWQGASTPNPNSLYGGFTIYGYGTGAVDYNVWTWTVLTLLEEYWRPMQSGETVYAYTRSGYAAVDAAMKSFITTAALVLSQTFLYGAGVLWDRAGQGDGTLENPWSYYDGWQGAGYYLMLPGSEYGQATMVTAAQKDLYF